jgi:hypothetical protein
MSEKVRSGGDKDELAKIRAELAKLLGRLDSLGGSFAAIHVASAIDAIDARMTGSNSTLS